MITIKECYDGISENYDLWLSDNWEMLEEKERVYYDEKREEKMVEIPIEIHDMRRIPKKYRKSARFLRAFAMFIEKSIEYAVREGKDEQEGRG